MTETKISVAKEFSQFPAGRLLNDGPFSGQAFRENLLVPALKRADKVDVIIDEVSGYGSSFLEEAFGGLVRSEGFKPDELLKKIKLTTHDPSFEMYIDEILDYIKSAK